MIITYGGGGNFTIKTRDAVVSLSDKGVNIDGFLIDSPGEYERKNIFVEAPFEQKIFRIMAEDVSILYVDKTKSIKDRQIEELEGTDIFFLPCGEDESMKISDALELSAKLEPGVIIPMYFSDVSILQKEGLDGEVSKSAKISKATLPEEGNQTIFLEKIS